MYLCTYLTAPKCVLRLLKFLATVADGTLKSPPLYIPPYHMCVCVCVIKVLSAIALPRRRDVWRARSYFL